MDKINVGDTLYGFCNGYFGRDSYGDKSVVAKGNERGHNWIVAWDEWEGQLLFAEGFSEDDALNWTTDDDKDWEGHDG